jgi:hypothetical protein
VTDDATELLLAEGGGAVAAGILNAAPVGVDDSGESKSCEDSIMLMRALLRGCGYYLDGLRDGR